MKASLTQPFYKEHRLKFFKPTKMGVIDKATKALQNTGYAQIEPHLGKKRNEI
jgi:hypothetical protein